MENLGENRHDDYLGREANVSKYRKGINNVKVQQPKKTGLFARGVARFAVCATSRKLCLRTARTSRRGKNTSGDSAHPKWQATAEITRIIAKIEARGHLSKKGKF